MEVYKNKNGGIMVNKVILYLLTMIFALSTATALAAEPADAPVSMRERMEKSGWRATRYIRQKKPKEWKICLK